MTLAKTVRSADADLPVTGGTFTPTMGSTTANVTASGTGAPVHLKFATQTVTMSVTGVVSVTEPYKAELRSDLVSLTAGSTARPLKLITKTYPQLLKYLRPQ